MGSTCTIWWQVWTIALSSDVLPTPVEINTQLELTVTTTDDHEAYRNRQQGGPSSVRNSCPSR
jgi:hypothetical protein